MSSHGRTGHPWPTPETRRPTPCFLPSAFTLVEMLLVMAIVGVLAAVTLPNLVKSIRGNRMRIAARTVVMAGRYARSMAVLKQLEYAVDFNLDRGEITVRETADRRRAAPVAVATNAAEDGTGPAAEEPPPPEAAKDGATPPPPSGGAAVLTRTLDEVKIESVAPEDGREPVTAGTCSIPYENNGRCTPYAVTLADSHGDRVEVRVDVFSMPETRKE